MDDHLIEQRRGLRETALLGAPFPLYDERGAFGPRLQPLTPAHTLRLLAAGNPIACGGPVSLASVVQYCWFCSPGWRPYAPLRARFFRWRWARALGRCGQPHARVLAALRAHFGLALLDRPALPVPRERARSAPAAATVPHDGPHELAALELVCRRALRYTAAEYWHTPWGHTNQLLALHFRGAAPDAPAFNPAVDRARGERLRARRAEWLRTRAAAPAPARPGQN